MAEELAKKRDGANALSKEKQAPRKAPKGPPSAFQTFQGGVIAGAIAYVLYIFATTVDAGFASRPVSTVYTVCTHISYQQFDSVSIFFSCESWKLLDAFFRRHCFSQGVPEPCLLNCGGLVCVHLGIYILLGFMTLLEDMHLA
jgi:hypothetical protein